MAGKQFEEKGEGCGNYSHRLGMGSALASVTDCTRDDAMANDDAADGV